MNYEKAYKEAIEIAREINNEQQAQPFNIMTRVFPELKESEDEKIRKDLINYFNGAALEHREEEVLAWLEKQGTSYTKKDVDDAYLEGVTNTKNEIEKQYEANYQIRKDIATFIFNYRGDIKDRAKWIDYLGIKVSFVEKQGEQKPVVTPKFKVGDTIKELETGNLFYVNSVEDFGYTLHYKNCNANGCTMSFKYEDNYELVEQKTEWSEEDEKHLNRIVEDSLGYQTVDDCVKRAREIARNQDCKLDITLTYHD